MNGEEKKASPNLNTIHEEFDLSDRIKSLKGKHIKIKKIVKKEDGNYSIRESSLFSEKSMEIGQVVDNSSPSYLAKESMPLSSSPSNMLPLDFNFQKQNSMPLAEYQFRKQPDYKSFGVNTGDYSLGGGFKREPVMPLSSSYTPKDYQMKMAPSKDQNSEKIELFSSG